MEVTAVWFTVIRKQWSYASVHGSESLPCIHPASIRLPFAITQKILTGNDWTLKPWKHLLFNKKNRLITFCLAAIVSVDFRKIILQVPHSFLVV